MKPLEACQIAVAAASSDSSVRARIHALERAGASVRFCALSQNLWSALSDAAFDLIVVILERDDVASLATYDQLRLDPRTRGITTLLVTHSAECAAERGAIMLHPQLDDENFVATLTAIATPTRRLREAEQQERSLREQLRGELARADRSARELADLSHELRSLLGPIVGFACNLRDEAAGPLLPDQKSHVAGILEAVERSTRLLEKTRSGSQTSMRRVNVVPASAPPRVQRTLVHLAEIATDVTALFEAVAARKSIRLQCACDDAVCVWGDGLKLKQVVTNLVVNALKYTPDGGEVAVRVAWSNPSVADGAQARRAGEIVVSDTGPGIAHEYRAQIFSRGFRIDRRADVAGEGIGLAVVKEIVTQHGGSVRVEGEVGAGAVFRVLLPQDRRLRVRTGPVEGQAE